MDTKKRGHDAPLILRPILRSRKPSDIAIPDPIRPTHNRTGCIAFDGRDQAVLDTLNNTDVVSESVIWLTGIIPVETDYIPCLWRNIAVLYPDAGLFEDINMPLHTAFRPANQIDSSQSDESSRYSGVTPTVIVRQSVSSRQWLMAIVNVHDDLVPSICLRVPEPSTHHADDIISSDALIIHRLILILISLIIGSLLLWIHQALGDLMIVVFAAAVTALILAIAFLYPFLSRIFNKFTPLEDGELKEKLTGLLEKHGYKVRAIQVMDASRRTTKSNAYFSGFGKMKTIVLFDTMLEQMTTDEICAVFAHEMGHGLHKDTLRNQGLSFLQMLVIGVLAWLTLRTPELWLAFGFDSVNYGFAMILIMGVEFALIAPLFGLLTNYLSRRAEYRADRQAVQEGYGEELISALKKLSRENLSDLAPSPLLVKLEYSHPTLSQRIEAIRKK